MVTEMGEGGRMIDAQLVRQQFRAAYAPADENVQIDVQPGSADYLHVLVISRTFEGLSMADRNHPAREAMRALGPSLALRITVVMLLTPEEHEDLDKARSLAV